MSEQPEADTLVSISEIARLARVQVSAVSNWRSRSSNFPAASSRSARGDLYPLSAVLAWLRNNSKIHDRDYLGPVLWQAAAATRGQGPEVGLLTCLIYLAVQAKDTKTAINLTDDSFSWRLAERMHRTVTDWGLDPQVVPDPRTLDSLREAFSSLDEAMRIRPVSRISDALVNEYMLHLGSKAEYYSSPAVQHLLAALVWRDTPGRVAMDPAVGSGGLLAAALNAHPTGAEAAYGADINATAASIAQARLSTRNLSAHMHAADVLGRDPFPGIKADAIVVDPPFGIRREPHSIDPALAAVMGHISASNTDWAWVFYVTEHLSVRGRGVILLPTGALFRGGSEATLRAEALRRGLIEGVISLPPRLTDRTAIPTVALILRAPGSRNRGADVVMLDATDTEGTWKDDPYGTAYQVAESFAAALTAEDPDVDDSRVAYVNILDALAPDATLLPTHWTTRRAEANPALVQKNLNSAYTSLAEIRERIATLAPTTATTTHIGEAPQWTTIGNLIDRGDLRLHRGLNIKHSEFTPEGVPVITTSSVTQGEGRHGGYLDASDPRLAKVRATQTGDIVFAPIGAKAIVEAYGDRIAVGPLVVLEIRDADEVLPANVLAAYLSTDAVGALAQGSTLQRVDVRQVPVPILSRTEARELSGEIDNLDAQVRAATQWAEAARTARDHLVAAVGVGVQP